MPRLHTHDQHFLRSPQLVARLVGHTTIRKNDTVYDLGAGSGVITSVLARRCRQVRAVEIEPGALKKLRANVGTLPHVEIIEKNILSLQPPEENYKIFANIPFSLSSDIIRHFAGLERPPRAMYFIVQKQFAHKLVPSNTHFTNQLSSVVGALYQARIRLPLRKTDFTPPPAVDTVLLELKQRETPLIAPQHLADYDTYTARCFASQPFFAAQPRAKAGISAELRPSQLTLEQWCALYSTARS